MVQSNLNGSFQSKLWVEFEPVVQSLVGIKATYYTKFCLIIPLWLVGCMFDQRNFSCAAWLLECSFSQLWFVHCQFYHWVISKCGISASCSWWQSRWVLAAVQAGVIWAHSKTLWFRQGRWIFQESTAVKTALAPILSKTESKINVHLVNVYPALSFH